MRYPLAHCVTEQKLLTEASHRRTRATAGLGRHAGGFPATAQGPAVAKRRAITDFDVDSFAVLVHLHVERVGPVVEDRIILRIARGEDGQRFTRREHASAHVALGITGFPGPDQFPECFNPVNHRLAINLHNDMADDGGAHTLVGQREMNVRMVAVTEFQDRPHRPAHLLALHIGGVTGNTQGEESHQGRDHRVVSAGAARCLLFRHEVDLIAGRRFMSIARVVN